VGSLPSAQANVMPTPPGEENAHGAAAGAARDACSTGVTSLIVRGRALILDEHVQTARPEQPGQGQEGGHPLKGQRCSVGRQPSRGPRRMRGAVGEAVWLATPAPCIASA